VAKGKKKKKPTILEIAAVLTALAQILQAIASLIHK
jgi:hypothetical protein